MLWRVLSTACGLAAACLLALSMFKGALWMDLALYWWLPALLLSTVLAGECWFRSRSGSVQAA